MTLKELEECVRDLFPFRGTRETTKDECPSYIRRWHEGTPIHFRCEMVLVHHVYKDEDYVLSVIDGVIYLTVQYILLVLMQKKYHDGTDDTYEEYSVLDIKEQDVPIMRIDQLENSHIEEYMYGWGMAWESIVPRLHIDRVFGALPYDFKPDQKILELKTTETLEDYIERHLVKSRLGKYMVTP